LLEFKSIEHNLLGVDYGANHSSEGKLTFLWVDSNIVAQSLPDSSAIFDIVFTKKGNIVNEDLSLNSDITPVLAFDGNYSKIGIQKSSGSIAEAAQLIAYTETWNVLPNPTIDGKVKIAISASSAKPVRFELTNMEGKVLLSQFESVPNGNSTRVLNLQGQHKLAAGIYYLKVVGMDSKAKQILLMK
ncbi:T9SS type A sorting domain-containing protein, partial [Parasediminibacterium sp. JCM 36343]|uniref:T9SS type A sorting domain-containing protein n=1 Tax=Parasediminibacterium sp. JCM 36343 TaxID=3374279 RepID=UPI00397C9720